MNLAENTLILVANVTVILSCGFAGHETRLQPALLMMIKQ